MDFFKLIWFKINSIVFFTIILCGGILFLVLPKEQISESEKRRLSPLPVLNSTNIFSGKFESEFDNYYNDNFIFRNHFISIANYIKENFGIKDNEIRMYSNVSIHKKILKKPALVLKDVVKDSNGLKSLTITDETNNDMDAESDNYENIKSVIVYKNRAIQIFGGSRIMMSKFASMLRKYKTEITGIKNIYCMAIPVGSDFYLPAKFSKTNEQSSIRYLYQSMDTSIRCVNVYDELASHKSEYIQFNTDHHWTGRGAYYAYQAFCKTAGFACLPIEKLQKKVIRNFLGTLYYYTLSESLKENMDSVEYFKIPNLTKAYYFNEGISNARPTKLYAEYARGGNSYGVFLGSDYPLMKIVSDVKNGRKILQIKDSYGNAFAPFLPAHFEEVYIVDYRYFNGNIKELIKKYAITDIIFSHNIYVINSSYTTFRETKMLNSYNQKHSSNKNKSKTNNNKSLQKADSTNQIK
jgi:hypothetical protein